VGKNNGEESKGLEGALHPGGKKGRAQDPREKSSPGGKKKVKQRRVINEWKRTAT